MLRISTYGFEKTSEVRNSASLARTSSLTTLAYEEQITLPGCARDVVVRKDKFETNKNESLLDNAFFVISLNR